MSLHEAAGLYVIGREMVRMKRQKRRARRRMWALIVQNGRESEINRLGHFADGLERSITQIRCRLNSLYSEHLLVEALCGRAAIAFMP